MLLSSPSGEESYRHGCIASREFLFGGRGAYTYNGCDEQRTKTPERTTGEAFASIIQSAQ